MLRSDSRFRCGTIAGGLFWREPSACESSHLNDPVAMPFQHSRDCLFAPNRLCAFSIRFSCDGRSELPGRGCREGFWPGTALTNGGGLKKLGVRGAHPGSIGFSAEKPGRTTASRRHLHFKYARHRRDRPNWPFPLPPLLPHRRFLFLFFQWRGSYLGSSLVPLRDHGTGSQRNLNNVCSADFLAISA